MRAGLLGAIICASMVTIDAQGRGANAPPDLVRQVRTAIDSFHDDWRNGAISKTGDGVSDDGFPKTLTVLVEGVEAGDAKGGVRKYLRRIPRDPFADASKDPEEQWSIRGYQDEADALSWNRIDVYDIRTTSEGTAIDGTSYENW